MGFADSYLAKHGTGNRQIPEPPHSDLKFIVVIPAYNEYGLIECLDTLLGCTPVNAGIEIITVINWPYQSDSSTRRKNIQILKDAEQWSKDHFLPEKRFHFMVAEPENEKVSGVGAARKAGMDEAISRLNDLNQSEGILLSLDADAQVDANYFSAIEQHFESNDAIDGCTIYFEHPLEGLLPQEVYEAVTGYELHLRVYLQSLRYAGLPNAFHTIGSSFAVKAKAYCSQGGMNRRQAGEDFYFLQKLFDLGNFSECNSTRVIPSPRPSLRVPFGTGPVIIKYQEERKEIQTRNPELFEILKSFLMRTDEFYFFNNQSIQRLVDDLHPLMRSFLIENQFQIKLMEIGRNSSSPETFRKRFYRWFNMFLALKFLNSGKGSFPDLPVTIAARVLLENLNIAGQVPEDAGKLLEIFRGLEKNAVISRFPR